MDGKTTQIDELSKWLPESGLLKKESKLITTKSQEEVYWQKLRGLILDNHENNKRITRGIIALFS